MNLSDLEDAAAAFGLFTMGLLQKDQDTIILLGANARMWPIFQASAETKDGRSDPLDRWSKRVIGSIARDAGAVAVFPSDGPPYAPFIAWAIETGRFWQSPTGMLIHDAAGLMISIRGALKVAGQHTLPETRALSPCDTCADKPCLHACPVGALSGETAYDVPACKTFIASEELQDCMTQGCKVRRACPISAAFERDPEQSHFHMRSFMGA